MVVVFQITFISRLGNQWLGFDSAFEIFFSYVLNLILQVSASAVSFV